ncbi:MAG: TIGR03936 family radical SAM-associated protein [Planctomycetota bacterium]|nr:TIGR03936 family radical SAM-associated protein [Planctomycetota bacterium]
MIRQKVEIRFEKSEAVRFISHHDLMRAFQRAVRRAALPVRLTEGFNPRPRIVFPAALEVGVASLDEVAELELNECIPLSHLKERLARTLPPGFTLISLKDLPLSRRVRQPETIRYRLHLAEAGMPLDPKAAEALKALPAIPFTRTRRGKDGRPRQIQADLKAYLRDAEAGAGGDLEVEVAAGPQGTARPLEFLSVLTQQPLETLKAVRVTKLKMTLKETEAPTATEPMPETEPLPNPET